MSKLGDTIADLLRDADLRWWFLLIGQVGVGMFLISRDAEFGKYLLSSALGQGATATIGARK